MCTTCINKHHRLLTLRPKLLALVRPVLVSIAGMPVAPLPMARLLPPIQVGVNTGVEGRHGL